MIKKLLILLCCCVFTLTAFADWDEGDPAKWIQLPDLTPTGIDICVDDTEPFGQRTIGDDFLCESPDPITDVHIWGSWRGDTPQTPNKGTITAIRVQFFTDDPVGPGGSNPDNEWSTPDIRVYDETFDEAQFTERLYYEMPNIDEYEWWWDPGNAISLTPTGDQRVWQYNIDLSNAPFQQEGLPGQPITYWLVIQVKIDQTIENTSFGWKTRGFFPERFQDDAVWLGAQWVDIEYPAQDPYTHPYWPDSLDMSFVLTTEQEEELDWGDAPDSPAAPGYPTLSINSGANHLIRGPWLGDGSDAPDPEGDGQPTGNADGDDFDGNDDENGVQIPVLTEGQVSTITFQVNGGGGTVSGWIDYNQNQTWGDVAVEQIVAAYYPVGTYAVNVTPPLGSAGTTYARFRITNDATVTGPTGPASDGEVEDYKVTIQRPTDGFDFGDAPEGANAIAYPSLGVMGQFPTCIDTAFHYIQHDNYGAYFGPMIDREADGNAGLCPTGTCFPPYDQDECFNDGDAGLMYPCSYTIDPAYNVIPCPGCVGISALGFTCQTATWGSEIDIDVTNNMPSSTIGYVQVLADWKQDGQWGGSATGACTAPEYILQDYQIPNPYSGPLSGVPAITGVALPTFTIGPNAGYVWVRFSITPGPLNNPNWDGSGIFEDGESEDYLLEVLSTPQQGAFKFEFSLDIGSDTELSDPQLDGDEVFDPGDIYWWQGPLLTAPTDGFKDDDAIFTFSASTPDPWPDPNPPLGTWQNTRVPIGDPLYTPASYHEFFDLDGHDQLENSLIDIVPMEPLTIPIAKYADRCIYEPNNLAISFDDDMAEGWATLGAPPPPGGDVPVTAPSPLGKIYGTGPLDDEIIGVTVTPKMMPTPISNIYPVADEKTVHQNMAPNPDAGDPDDDDVDSLDVVPDEQSCPVLLFSPDHEATFMDASGTWLDPGGIYERIAGGPIKVIDEEIHLGIWDDPTTEDIVEDADVDAFEFIWFPADVQGGMALALLFSVDEDDPLTPGIDESGGLVPSNIYLSFLTGSSFLYARFDDDVDGLTNWYTTYDCISNSASFYQDWLTFGRPSCWCYQYQCRGDGNDALEGNPLAGYRRVFNNDLALMLSAYDVKEPPHGPGVLSVPNGICADFDHAQEGNPLGGYRRVFNADLAILLANYDVKEPPIGPGLTICPLTTAGGDIIFYTYGP